MGGSRAVLREIDDIVFHFLQEISLPLIDERHHKAYLTLRKADAACNHVADARDDVKTVLHSLLFALDADHVAAAGNVCAVMLPDDLEVRAVSFKKMLCFLQISNNDLFCSFLRNGHSTSLAISHDAKL